ncbi:MAG: hypothetical protein JXQ69_02570 [Paludibacteraceae bacterium]|nr:hypothetical protein [Paludibacteraceae bacterium]MBN2787185.1 hypothetical protein [Paludibacteraceae bacterium]
MKRKVAIPILNDLLSEQFGQCNYIQVVEMDKKPIKSYSLVLPVLADLTQIPVWLAKQGITDIITYKIEKQIISLFHKEKISVFIGIKKDTPENLIRAFIDGNLQSDSKIINELNQ